MRLRGRTGSAMIKLRRRLDGPNGLILLRSFDLMRAVPVAYCLLKIGRFEGCFETSSDV